MNLADFIHINITEPEEIIFFGGSFNPWHEGHSECIKLLNNDKPLIVIPDHNPYKEVIENKRFDSEQILKKLLKIRSHIFVYTHFLDKNEKNPTSKWIQELKNTLPSCKFSLLVGFDSFNSIEKWIDSTQLLNNLNCLYIASRLESEKQRENQIHILKNINPKLKLVFLGHHKYEDISSTQLRENLKNC